MSITKDMTVAEVLIYDRSLANVFVEHGVKCLGCPSASIESIEQISQVYGLNAQEIVNELNTAHKKH